MVEKSQCAYIGTISKTHGIHGGLTIRNENGLPQELQEMESVFVEIDGGLVPFFLNDCHFNNDIVAIIEFDSLSDPLLAKALTNKDVYVLSDEVEEFASPGIIGYKAIDKIKGELGFISKIELYGKNELFSIDEGKYLIPVTDDFIVDVDQEKKVILFNLPEGLTDLESNE